MSTTFVGTVEMTTIDCKCGGTYAITERFRAECYNNGTGWHCPYCRIGWGFSGSRIKQLETQLANESERRQRAEQRAQQAASERDHHWTERKKLYTRHRHLRERVKHGVCPCCHRTVSQLARHMASKHPDYAATA